MCGITNIKYQQTRVWGIAHIKNQQTRVCGIAHIKYQHTRVCGIANIKYQQTRVCSIENIIYQNRLKLKFRHSKINMKIWKLRRKMHFGGLGTICNSIFDRKWFNKKLAYSYEYMPYTCPMPRDGLCSKVLPRVLATALF